MHDDQRPTAALPDAPDEDAAASPEARERAIAWRRGRSRARGAEAPRRPDGALIPHAFAALAENVRDYAIFLMDPEGRITFWGEGARLIKWWTKNEAEGGHLRMLYPEGGSEDGTAEAHLAQSAATGEYSGEGHRVRSDGSTFWAGITLTALRDDSGALLGFAKVTRDLTARRASDTVVQAAAEAAERARAAAEVANAAKSSFLATMSHEIRTPINAILGYHQLLELELRGPLSPGQREYLARAAASGRHLLALVDEVLDFSRVESGRVRVSRRAFRVGDAVTGAVSLLAPQAGARGLVLSDETSGAAADVAAWGDEARARQILVNLLANAVKFTEPGGRVTVSAGTAESPSPDAELFGSGPWVYVRVEDTGPGIGAGQLGRIFEPFVQADMALTREHGGTGLGLAISRRLARLMGGDITVRSEPGVGATFFLWLSASAADSRLAGDGPGHAFDHHDADEKESADGRGGGLRQSGDALLADLEQVLRAYAGRLRADPETPSAHGLSGTEVEDHAAALLADVSATLAGLDLAGRPARREARDGAAIQRAVGARHGAQRAALGWSESELRRDFAVLREEVAAALRRTGIARRDADAAVAAANEMIAVAERASVAEWGRAQAAGAAQGA